jgi:hypothetical protein
LQVVLVPIGLIFAPVMLFTPVFAVIEAHAGSAFMLDAPYGLAVLGNRPVIAKAVSAATPG